MSQRVKSFLFQTVNSKFTIFILLFFIVIVACKKENQPERLTEEQIKRAEFLEYQQEQDSIDQAAVLDASLVLTRYKHLIEEENEFIARVDEEIKQGRYEGYDIEYFYFHDFREDVVSHLYKIFFDEYDYFSTSQQDELIKTATDTEMHTWNSKKKELAILGTHLQMLAESFGKESDLLDTYKAAYMETKSVSTAASFLLPEALRNERLRQLPLAAFEKVMGRKLSKSQARVLADIILIDVAIEE